MLEDLGSQVGAIGLLLTIYLFLWERSRAGQKMFDETLSDLNALGTTRRDAQMAWIAFRRELPMLLVIFFAPVMLGLVFLPPALEILANIRPGRPYSPLRAAFLVIETGWVTVACFLGRRAFSCYMARFLRDEAGWRWEVEQGRLREQKRLAAEQRTAESPIGEDARNHGESEEADE